MKILILLKIFFKNIFPVICIWVIGIIGIVGIERIILFFNVQNVQSANIDQNQIRKVGIVGDIHGDIELFRDVLKQMQKLGVTDIILMGDYGGRDGDLELVIDAVSTFLILNKERVHLLIGDEDQYIDQLTVRKYKKIINIINPDAYYESGKIIIAERKIMVSHFPQHRIPKYAGPILEILYSRKNPKQAMIIDTMAFNDYPNRFVDLEIFAHTHKMLSYIYEDESGARTRVINPGAINGKKIGANEFIALSSKNSRSKMAISSYAIYDTTTNEINFYNALNGTGIFLGATANKRFFANSDSKRNDIFKPSRGDLIWISELERVGGERPWEMLGEIHKAKKIKDANDELRAAIAIPVACPVPVQY